MFLNNWFTCYDGRYAAFHLLRFDLLVYYFRPDGEETSGHLRFWVNCLWIAEGAREKGAREKGLRIWADAWKKPRLIETAWEEKQALSGVKLRFV